MTFVIIQWIIYVYVCIFETRDLSEIILNKNDRWFYGRYKTAYT